LGCREAIPPYQVHLLLLYYLLQEEVAEEQLLLHQHRAVLVGEEMEYLLGLALRGTHQLHPQAKETMVV
jgi:hypothetical protein